MAEVTLLPVLVWVGEQTHHAALGGEPNTFELIVLEQAGPPMAIMAVASPSGRW